VTAATAIAVEGLVKRYGGRAVVDDVSFHVEPGELVAILGPNGAGKTTTVEMIEGYRRPDGGTVRVLGIDPRSGGRALRARVGLMLQAGGFDMRSRPLETVRQYAAFHADPRDPGDLVDRLGLRAVAGTPYRRLSGGERQRMALAVALVGRPEVVILDEPTAGMDPEARATVRALIADLRSDGLAILLTSHDLLDVERLADRIVILAAGRVVASGSAAALAAGLRPRLRIRLDRPLDPTERAELALAAGAPLREIEPGRYELDGVPPSPGLVAAVAAACASLDRLIVESRAVGGSLEDAYLELVGADGRATATAASGSTEPLMAANDPEEPVP
jgi:ABC-2 type transport system ATP-binding protein